MFPSEDPQNPSSAPLQVSSPEFEYDFFLSFAGTDAALARRAYDQLCNFGYKVCFQDVDFQIGRSFLEEMMRAHMSSRKVIVLLTPNYFAISKYTQREFEAALEDDKLLIFRFHNAAVPSIAYAQIRQDFPDELTSSESLELLRSAARLQPKRTTHMVKRIDLRNLPQWQGGEHSQRRLIGRDAQLAQLSSALADEETSIVCIIADGGFGKSSLVQRWVHDLSVTKYAGLDAAFAYSFYKQGWEGGAAVVTAPFFGECLCALTGRSDIADLDKRGEQVWQQEILDIVQRQRVLLILDGLEPHQHPRGHVDEGKIIQPLLREFLDKIKDQAKRSEGLCVITSRIMPPNLAPQANSHESTQIKLQALDHASSVEAFVAAGLAADNPTLDAWADKSGGHPLLISLLAPAIQSGHYDPEMFRADQVLTEHHTKNVASTVQNVVATRLEQLGVHAKAVLYCVALFGRAVSYEELKEDILDYASIPVFTEPLYNKEHGRKSSEKLFTEGAEALKKAAMLSFGGTGRLHDKWLLEAHPLVQAGVRCQIESKCLPLWKRANWAVYQSITKSVKEPTPDDRETLHKLYLAVPHGVQAGQGKKAGWMYAKRCLRGFRAYSTNRGMVADDVALISNYFEGNWQRLREDIGLNSYAKVQAYVWAGVLLTAVNRAHEGLELMEKGLQVARDTRNFTTAARTARFLGVLYAMHGDLLRGEKMLRASIADLDRHSTLLIRLVELKLVDRNFQRMASHTMLASVLHEQGRFQEAEASFRDAETIQKKATHYVGLRNIWCYRKVEFLHDAERFAEAREALAAASVDPEEPKGWGEGVFVDVILQLSRMRGAIREADMLGARPDPEILNDGEVALKKLEADQGFRMDWLMPVARIAIAGKARLTNAFPRATVALAEAEALINKSGNIIFRVDLLMERSRLHLACGDADEAMIDITQASELANQTKYLCRNTEISKVQLLCSDASAKAQYRSA